MLNCRAILVSVYGVWVVLGGLGRWWVVTQIEKIHLAGHLKRVKVLPRGVLILKDFRRYLLSENQTSSPSS